MFAAYRETSYASALGRVRDKIRRGIATRHLASSRGGPQMLHDELRGHITSEDGQVAIVVDGVPLDGDDLLRILESHEGWNFKLRIVDPLK